MFNLLMSGNGWEPGRQSFGRGRTLEYTDEKIVMRFMPDSTMDTLAVQQLPSLFVSETVHDNSQMPARICIRPGYSTYCKRKVDRTCC